MASKKTESTALANIESPGALANIDFGEHAGGGKANMTSEDQKIPYLFVLQALSKVVSDPSKKVAGAESGMLFDSVSKELYDGQEGIIIVPCSTRQLWVEWQGAPGSGTVVNRFSPQDPVVVEARRKFGFNEEKTAAGNSLVQTFYVIGMILPTSDATVPSGAVLIPFSSTKITPYQESIGVMRTLLGKAPLYAFRLRVRTKSETRPKGTYFNFSLMPDGYDGNVFKDGIMASFMAPDTEQAQILYPLAKVLADDFDAGTANIAYDTESGASTGDAVETEPY